MSTDEEVTVNVTSDGVGDVGEEEQEDHAVNDGELSFINCSSMLDSSSLCLPSVSEED